jgi:S1-C subfamily serine protease
VFEPPETPGRSTEVEQMYQDPGSYRYDPVPPARRRYRRALPLGVATLAAAAAVVAVVYSTGSPQVVSGTGAAVQPAPAMDRHGTSRAPGSTATPGSATAAQQIGVVDINTVLKYQGAAAAGTGMVLTSSGEILTNNHVVAGATSISVQVVTTAKSYRAVVVGTDPADDVAVLRLQDASGLQTANVGDSSAVKVGDAVTGVGNAGGLGATPSAAAGTVVALDRSLTATDESGQNSERLTGMIETNAPIQAGDSGGPLYDAANRVIGMDTAASASGRGAATSASQPGAATGFAIPIARATAIAGQIEAGHASTTIHLGYPGFLGVSATASTSTPGALVESVLAGGPAAQAGLGVGDVITAVAGTAVRSSSGLHATVAAHKPGDTVTVTWSDTGGQTHHASITLAVGPVD